MTTHASRSAEAFSRGFTLVEMAIVLVVMGLVMLTVLPALKTVRSASQLSLTQSNLRSLMLATATYIQANGCLPCPAIPGGTREKFGKVATINNAACGVCSWDTKTVEEGIPPFVSLGLPASIAHDGWGHWITMHIDTALTNPSSTFVPPTSPCTTQDVASNLYNCTVVGSSVKGLCTTETSAKSSALSGVQVKTTGFGGIQYAAVLFISHGTKGYGSYIAKPKGDSYERLSFPDNYSECGSNGGYARCNADGTKIFYDAPISLSDTDPYDDILAYANRNALVSMFGTGTCNTNW